MRAEARKRRDLRIVLECALGFSSKEVAQRHGVRPRTVTDKVKRFREGDLPTPEGAVAERLRRLARAQEAALPKMSLPIDPEAGDFGNLDLPIQILAEQFAAIRELGLGDLVHPDVIGVEEFAELRDSLGRVLLRHGASEGLREDVLDEMVDWFQRHKAPWSLRLS